MRRKRRVMLYFSVWVLLALICVVLNVLNVKWAETHVVQGVVVVVVLGVLQGSVMELPVQTLATLIIGGNRRHNRTAPADHLTVVLNYNILATSRDDVDECLQTMYEAYLGNLAPRVSAVLVSATNDPDIKDYELQLRDHYRALLYDTLFREGLSFAANHLHQVDPLRLDNVWSRYSDVQSDVFVRDQLDGVCNQFAGEFMVVQRVSRVLRKCGQYQDLMLLSAGDSTAFTYTDPDYYGRQARTPGEPLFHASEDVDKVFNRQFDYTLVLDGDTGVTPGSVFKMLEVAAAHPDRGIIQPAIRLHCSDTDTLFMHLETARQEIYEPITNALTALLEQSSYFGKALIHNRVYIDKVIGSRQQLVERVPVDVLSHDTFEAALLRPVYCGSVFLLEAPSLNYVTWNIRERRWNRGEVILAMYFWRNAVGRPMRWIQRKLQGEKFNPTKLRTETPLDFVTSYVAHSALRQMFMKPLLLVYIIITYRVELHFRYPPLAAIMFLILVFPKFATINRRNVKFVLLETLASFVQFTPEAMVGTVRIFRAVQANLVLNAKWVPQRAVEEDFKQSNPFKSSFVHLWGYSAFAFVAAALVAVFASEGILILVMLGMLFLLPVYTGFTSLSKGLESSVTIARREKAKAEDSVAIVGRSDPKLQSPVFTASDNLTFLAESGSNASERGRDGVPSPPPSVSVENVVPSLDTGYVSLQSRSSLTPALSANRRSNNSEEGDHMSVRSFTSAMNHSGTQNHVSISFSEPTSNRIVTPVDTATNPSLTEDSTSERSLAPAVNNADKQICISARSNGQVLLDASSLPVERPVLMRVPITSFRLEPILFAPSLPVLADPESCEQRKSNLPLAFSRKTFLSDQSMVPFICLP